ncbi:MAG: hypothetical protein HYY18_02375 [Planctomycetes bacterium]|nr:hypothetical protein [Planctomycetota bacterium]
MNRTLRVLAMVPLRFLFPEQPAPASWDEEKKQAIRHRATPYLSVK